MSATKIYGLIGYPVKHSLSSLMHNAAFRELGIDAEYRLFEVKPAELKDFLLDPTKRISDTNGNYIRAFEIAGFNITIPHKVQAKEILAQNPYFTNEEPYYVELSGAINTVKRNNGGGSYWNTDAHGFAMALEENLHFRPITGLSMLVIGCGGAGRVVITSFGRKDSGVNKIYIYEISMSAAQSAQTHFSRYYSEYPHLVSKLEFISKNQIGEVMRGCQLLVNASPVGMEEGDGSAIDKNLLHKDLSVYDLVYNRETQLIKDARSLGLPAAGGVSMLLHQGAYAFTMWTGKEAPIKVMENVLAEARGKV